MQTASYVEVIDVDLRNPEKLTQAKADSDGKSSSLEWMHIQLYLTQAYFFQLRYYQEMIQANPI